MTAAAVMSAPMRFIEMEACPVCGSASSRAAPRSFDELRRCARCGTVYAGAYPDPDAVYVDGYYHGEAPAGFGIDVSSGWWQQYLMGAGRQREVFVRRTSRSGGMLLDVGCGTGEFLAAADAAGWIATGVEPVADSAEIARQRGLEVYCGLLEEAPADQQYDVVSAVHVVEHLPEVVPFLRALAARVRPGGLVFVEVPNWGSAMRLRLNSRWHHLRSEHIVYFTPRTLAAAFRRARLQPITVESRSWMPRYLHAAIQQMPVLQRPLTRALLPFCNDHEIDGRNEPVPGRLAWMLLCGASKALDAAKAGDVVVAIGRVGS
jgi:2-polyprenyl-3-methyl-5-hydroxy-6-metoxy-1,4-benzoquinol methylase